ncbi:MAG TPA: clostripain-related cysteine peptidase [Candidatus Ozemobacteraceae bacterium]
MKASPHHRFLTGVLAVVLALTAAVSWAGSNLDADLKLIREVQQKKVTLQYLADPRTKAFLTDLLKDFPEQIRKNFKANITGAYRKQLLTNYDAKMAEVSGDILAAIGDDASREQVITAAEAAPFPLDLAYAGVVKRLADALAFGRAQRIGSTSLISSDAASRQAERIETLLGRFQENAGRDTWEAVGKLYASVPRRDFPIWWYDDAQHDDVPYITHGPATVSALIPQKRKSWTVLVFLNADNDLESSGMKDLNEMEMIGSDENLNIVVQIDRQKGAKGETIEDGNWIGTRRYEVARERTKKIGSKLVANLGERDMGSRRELAEFLTWGVENYPAERFMAVIWNHGAGWVGISYDDESGNNLTIPDIVWACSQAKPALAKANPKHPKFDIIDFDACLMGMIEIAYELRDVCDFMIASEETEPGQGMPYQDTLRPLRETPGITPRMASKAMVAAYVKSFAAGGSQTTKTLGGAPVTKAAYDLSRIQPLVELVSRLGAALDANHDAYTQALIDEYGSFARIRRYSEASFVDLHDLVVRLATIRTMPAEVQNICIDIVKKLGYPKLTDRLSQPVVIRRRTPGAVIWGYNGWKLPPAELRPRGSAVWHSRFVRTPLRGPDEKGDYTCVIGPFSLVVDPVAKKREYVTEINYRIEYTNGKTSPDFTDRTGREYVIVTDFPAESPLIAEGHTQGMGNSYGISVYYPYCLEFRTAYKSLAFARDTAWDEFIARVPAYRATSPVLVTGGMVEDPSSLRPLMASFKDLGLQPDILWDPKVFGYKYGDILQQYRNGVVFTDSVSASSFGEIAPSADDLVRYLDGGGALFLAAQSVEQKNTNMPLLEGFFGFRYVGDDRDLPAMTLTTKSGAAVPVKLNGEDSAQSAKDVTIMEADAPAKAFIKTEDGRVAALAVAGTSSGSGMPYRGVYLGFRFEAVTGAAVRTALVENALDLLAPQLKKLPKPLESSTDGE